MHTAEDNCHHHKFRLEQDLVHLADTVLLISGQWCTFLTLNYRVWEYHRVVKFLPLLVLLHAVDVRMKLMMHSSDLPATLQNRYF